VQHSCCGVGHRRRCHYLERQYGLSEGLLSAGYRESLFGSKAAGVEVASASQMPYAPLLLWVDHSPHQHTTTPGQHPTSTHHTSTPCLAKTQVHAAAARPPTRCTTSTLFVSDLSAVLLLCCSCSAPVACHCCSTTMPSVQQLPALLQQHPAAVSVSVIVTDQTCCNLPATTLPQSGLTQ
jgi:hypothetical protein